MSKRKAPDDFLAEYKEWLNRIDNPYFNDGKFSKFTIRAFKNRKKPTKSDGAVYFLGGLFITLVLLAISWSMIKNKQELYILWFTIPFSIVSLLMSWRGITLMLGMAPDMKDQDD